MKQNVVIIAAIALLFGIGIGTLIDSNTPSKSSSEVEHSDDHSAMDDAHDSSNSHSMYMVDGEGAPTVDVLVTEDGKSGWNVAIQTTNFAFTPQMVNRDNVMGEGHAHLYVDGEKVARLYGPYFHYGENFDGSREFRVTLNANDHSEYAVGGQVIEATQTVTHEAHGTGHSQ